MGAVVFIVLLIFLPYIQNQKKIFPQDKLYGAEITVKRPSLSFKTWFSGKYSTDFEQWNAYNIGFRSLCVKVIHQIKFLLFKDIEGNSRTLLTLGQHDWLYETSYIDEAINPEIITEQEREFFVSDLKKLQDELHKLGILFVLAISPSKVSIIPDYLPESIKKQIDNSKKSNYELLIPELRAKGVRVADGNALFKKLRTGMDFLFPPGGTHWSYNGSFYFCRYLLEMLKSELPHRIIMPELLEAKLMLPQGTDNDIAKLLNLFFYTADKIKLPYPDIYVDALPIAQRPDILVIGDSFGLAIMDWMNQFKVGNKIDFLYYNNRHFDYPPSDIPGYFLDQKLYYGEAITPETMDWNTLLLSKDIVILEINEYWLKAKGWGFVDNALEKIDPDFVNKNIRFTNTHLTQTQVSQLYVAIFGRASEGEGNAYWCSTQESITAAADAMLATAAAQNYFGATLNNNKKFIEFIYENTLGKTYADDSEGVRYWVSELSAGKSKGQVVATMINAAIDPQYAGTAAQNQFINKVVVCNYTVGKITTIPNVNDLSDFVNFIKGVTHDSSTVAAAKAAVDAF